jgi:hypothetical protein
VFVVENQTDLAEVEIIGSFRSFSMTWDMPAVASVAKRIRSRSFRDESAGALSLSHSIAAREVVNALKKWLPCKCILESIPHLLWSFLLVLLTGGKLESGHL